MRGQAAAGHTAPTKAALTCASEAVLQTEIACTGDALYLGDSDDAVRELCSLLGWQEELQEMVQEGHARFASQ